MLCNNDITKYLNNFDHLGNHNDIIGYKMTYLVKIITKLVQDNQIGYVDEWLGHCWHWLVVMWFFWNVWITNKQEILGKNSSCLFSMILRCKQYLFCAAESCPSA